MNELRYPMDSDLSSGQLYPPFEQLASGEGLISFNYNKRANFSSEKR